MAAPLRASDRHSGIDPPFPEPASGGRKAARGRVFHAAPAAKARLRARIRVECLSVRCAIGDVPHPEGDVEGSPALPNGGKNAERRCAGTTRCGFFWICGTIRRRKVGSPSSAKGQRPAAPRTGLPAVKLWSPKCLREVEVADACRMHLARLARLTLHFADAFPAWSCPHRALTRDGIRALALGYERGFSNIDGFSLEDRLGILRRHFDDVDFDGIRRLSKSRPRRCRVSDEPDGFFRAFNANLRARMHPAPGGDA